MNAKEFMGTAWKQYSDAYVELMSMCFHAKGEEDWRQISRLHMERKGEMSDSEDLAVSIQVITRNGKEKWFDV